MFQLTNLIMCRRPFRFSFHPILLLIVSVLMITSCNHEESEPPEQVIVKDPEKMDVRVAAQLKRVTEFALQNKGQINDTIKLVKDSLVEAAYRNHDYQPIWTTNENWLPEADSLISFIGRSKEFGLFPSDYHYKSLIGTLFLLVDTAQQRDAAHWTRFELMLTDAFFELCKDLKQGRLAYDSTTLRKDTILPADLYFNSLNFLKSSKNVSGTLEALQPKHKGYDSLRLGLKYFLDSIKTFKRYTFLYYPSKDTAGFKKQLQKRLFEDDLLPSATDPIDTATWRRVLSEYQKAKGLRQTGRINENTVASLNNTDWEKFKRIAINMDRYKLLPDTLPTTYIWVNLPAYNLKLMDSDTLALESRVIVGQTKTRTPVLTSAVTNFITYPQWNVPESIIFKEMLPAIRKDTNYLLKQNLMVVDKNDSIISPSSINWYRLNKNYFPYRIKQREGDDNSLGVLKFNFANKYAVYLHDTNARWLFAQANRALSHGCVRVKEWEKLSHFLVRNNLDKYPPDTLRNWIKREEKHVVWGFPRVPIYIRYFSAEGKNGKLKLYDDIYGEDRLLREKYFADKPVQ